MRQKPTLFCILLEHLLLYSTLKTTKSKETTLQEETKVNLKSFQLYTTFQLHIESLQYFNYNESKYKKPFLQFM